jgi:hypothetical protein
MLGDGEPRGKEIGAVVPLWSTGGNNEPVAHNEKSGAVNQETAREATPARNIKQNARRVRVVASKRGQNFQRG